MPQPEQPSRYTYAEWLALGEGVRAEIIDGELYMMQTPYLKHQAVSRDLFFPLWDFLKGHPDKEVLMRINVRLDEDTVLEPDIVVCDKTHFDEQCYNGPPDMIIEILSPDTTRRDRWIKYNLYQTAGVREYWVIDPDAKTVDVNLLSDVLYSGRTYGDTDAIPVKVLPGCEISLADVFAE